MTQPIPVPCAPVPPSRLDRAGFAWGEPLADYAPAASFDKDDAERRLNAWGVSNGHAVRLARTPYEGVPHPDELWHWRRFSIFADSAHAGTNAVLAALLAGGPRAALAEFSSPEPGHVLALRAAVVPQLPAGEVADALASAEAATTDPVQRLLASAAFAPMQRHTAALASAPDDLLAASDLSTLAALLIAVPDAATRSREAARLGAPGLRVGWDDATTLQVLGIDGVAGHVAQLDGVTDGGSGAYSFAALTALPDEPATAAAVPALVSLAHASAAADLARDWLAARPVALAAHVGYSPADLPLLAAAVSRVRARDTGLLPTASDPLLAGLLAELDEQSAAPASEPGWWADALTAESKAPRPTGRGGFAAPRDVPWFATASALPPVPLGDGTRLAAEAAADLVAAAVRNAKDPELRARPLVAAARAHLSAGVRDRLAIALFDGYLTSGADSKLRAYAIAGGLLGDAGFVDHVAPLILTWPGRMAYQRSVLALLALAATGSRHAMQVISERFTKVKTRTVRQGAEDALARAAVASGMSKDAYEDTLVPDGGLDGRGGLDLSYGARAFRATLLPDGSTPVRELGADGRPLPGAGGRPKKSLPAPRADDDPDAAAEAKRALAATRRALRGITASQTRRLERALVTRREWTPAQLADYLAHPVLGGLARPLVWQASTGELFRATEEGELLAVEEEVIALDPAATVTLAHPLLLDADAAAAWRAHLRDHDLIAPFDQLDRTVVTLSDDVTGPDLPARLLPRSVHPGTLLSTLERSGWERGPNGPGGFLDTFVLRHPRVTVELRADPGVHPAAIGDGDPVDVASVRAEASGVPAPWPDLDPVLTSEVLATLAHLHP